METKRTGAETLERARDVERAHGVRPTRGYSRAFTPHKNAKRRGFYIDKIPPALHEAVMARARREGVSIRALVLAYLADWSAGS